MQPGITGRNDASSLARVGAFPCRHASPGVLDDRDEGDDVVCLEAAFDDEIDVANPGGGKHPAEFDAWRWEKLSRMPGLIVPFKRDAYEKVVAAFADIPERFA